MAAIINGGRTIFNEWVIEKSDPRTENWLLMGSVWNAVAIIGVYVYFVKNLGPKLMKNRPAFKVDGVMKAYNLLQIAYNIYMLIYTLDVGWAFKYKWMCEPVDYSNSPSALEPAKAVWLYMMLKVLDFMDTVFSVLRKKNSQVTFLHVYHHAGMFLAAWICTKYLPGGHLTLTGPINSFIHILMYAYYFVTITWPEYKSRLWWKKHLTQMQMVQFTIIFIHSFSLLFMDDTCAYPKIIALLWAIQNATMFFMFAEFYRQTYMKKVS